jgi:hypothetical protein
MNIGKWIIVSFILFGLFMAGLVIVCMRQEISLVSTNYYDEELQFQHQIDRAHNANLLERKPSVEVNGRMLTLAWNQRTPVTDATVNLFCPANAKMDRTFKLNGEQNKQSIALDDLGHGMYRVKLRWSMNNMEYFQEQVINL